ncbi:hypothetical protein BDV36DRAFT_299003 [Aspergillus pseudocaelatus]|uniref:Uncharacterized protein n=1 Tax=Aspergillus pseudocaelatus TaxID=1825620 RepID=A0ABQ6WBG2_9EURO|nr:hypothetical protein BDV36DRAFT_299003 [Aspergillus pseudocaelatus]
MIFSGYVWLSWLAGRDGLTRSRHGLGRLSRCRCDEGAADPIRANLRLVAFTIGVFRLAILAHADSILAVPTRAAHDETISVCASKVVARALLAETSPRQVFPAEATTRAAVTVKTDAPMILAVGSRAKIILAVLSPAAGGLAVITPRAHSAVAILSKSEDNGSQDQDVSDATLLFADNEHPPEYYIHQLANFDETDYTEEYYGKGTTALRDRVEDGWSQ